MSSQADIFTANGLPPDGGYMGMEYPFLGEFVTPFPLGDQQIFAIGEMLNWYKAFRQNPDKVKNKFILTGFAGSGKTSIVNPFIQAAGVSSGSVSYGALTGKAAQVLVGKGLPANTIHSQIYTFTDDPDVAREGLQDHINMLRRLSEKMDDKEYQKIIRLSIKDKKEDLKKIKDGEHDKSSKWFVPNPESTFNDKSLIVIDEASMVDKFMEVDILAFGNPVLFLGDPMQLKPTSDIGSVLYTSKKVPIKPDYHLTEIHRQAAENPIIRLSMDIRNGKMPRLGKMGNEVVVAPSADINTKVLVKANQVICGRNQFRKEINDEIREYLGYENEFPHKGEKLICRVNNQGKMIFNGITLTADSDAELVNPSQGIYALDYTTEDGMHGFGELFHSGIMNGTLDKNKITSRMRKDYIFADYGYAITAHSSQGSTYKNTMVFGDPIGRSKEDYIRWWYTAVTRASHKLIIGL